MTIKIASPTLFEPSAARQLPTSPARSAIPPRVKVFDLLFPTDDRNWGIGPTPVAEEERDLKQIGRDIETLTVAANASPTPEKAGELAGEADALAQKMAELEEGQHEAREKSDLMQGGDRRQLSSRANTNTSAGW